MFCINCGAELREEAKFCNNCGQPVVPVVLHVKPSAPAAQPEPPEPMPVAQPASNPAVVYRTPLISSEPNTATGLAATEIGAAPVASAVPVEPDTASPVAAEPVEADSTSPTSAEPTPVVAAEPLPLTTPPATETDKVAPAATSTNEQQAPANPLSPVPPSETAAAPKKKKKAGLVVIIVVAAVIVLALIGAAVAWGLGAFKAPQNALAASVQGLSKVVSDSSSGTASFGLSGGTSSSAYGNGGTVKWQLGQDLKSSSFSYAANGSNNLVLVRNDQLVYRDSSGQSQSVAQNVIENLSAQINQTYQSSGLKVDLNQVVKDQHINLPYLEQLEGQLKSATSKLLQGQGLGNLLGSGSSTNTDVDTAAMQSLIQGFVDSCNQPAVYQQFLSDYQQSGIAGGTEYQFKVDLNGFISALESYCSSQEGSNSSTAAAAKQLRSSLGLIDTLESSSNSTLSSFAPKVDLQVSGGYLSHAAVSWTWQGQGYQANLDISNLNNTVVQ